MGLSPPLIFLADDEASEAELVVAYAVAKDFQDWLEAVGVSLLEGLADGLEVGEVARETGQVETLAAVGEVF
jgi:hypothetical protein